MKTKLMITGMSVTILALATPVYAGHLGGGLGGGLGGTIGSSFGAGGGFASHGGLDDSLNATDTRAVRQSADKANAKTGTAAQAVGGATDSTNANVGKVAAGAGSNVQGEAAKSAAAPAAAKPAGTTAASASRSKPAASTNLTGASDETLHAGGRDVSSSGTGSVGADHSPGSNPVEASATASGSQH
jgi:hypothetical protein